MHSMELRTCRDCRDKSVSVRVKSSIGSFRRFFFFFSLNHGVFFFTPYVLDIHAYPHRNVTQSRYALAEKSRRSFECPRLVRIVQVGLFVIPNDIAVCIDDERRVVVRRVGGPVVGQVDLFGVSGDDDAFMLQGNAFGPQGADSRPDKLQTRTDVSEGREVVACPVCQ